MSGVDAKFADYYALKARQEDVTAMGGCNCCAAVKGRIPKPRRYWWITKTGHREGLCDDCFAVWVQGAAEDNDLCPAGIEVP